MEMIYRVHQGSVYHNGAGLSLIRHIIAIILLHWHWGVSVNNLRKRSLVNELKDKEVGGNNTDQSLPPEVKCSKSLWHLFRNDFSSISILMTMFIVTYLRVLCWNNKHVLCSVFQYAYPPDNFTFTNHMTNKALYYRVYWVFITHWIQNRPWEENVLPM